MPVRPISCQYLTIPLLLTLLVPGEVPAQSNDLIWGRVHDTAGSVHEGFIRWDRNEGVWADLLDGSKETPPLEYQDWWVLAHPSDRERERVIEVAGYRITWDDEEPEFSSRRESGIRFGHLAGLTVTGDDSALLTLRSGQEVELEGGSTDLGTDLRDIVVTDRAGREVELEWGDVERVEFMPAPQGVNAPTRRLFGTIQMKDGPTFTGYIAWDSNVAFGSETLEKLGVAGRSRGVPLSRVGSIRPSRDGARIRLSDGTEVDGSDSAHLDWGNPSIQISDPGLGQVTVQLRDVEEIRFDTLPGGPGWEKFDGGRPLRGTVVTADSTELTGWIRWDADEGSSWEILDGRDGRSTFDVEFGQIASIARTREVSVTVNVGVAGAGVDRDRREGVAVTLLDGRVLHLDGSNDVSEDNDGVFVLPNDSAASREDPDAVWIMVRWGDFREIRFEPEGGS